SMIDSVIRMLRRLLAVFRHGELDRDLDAEIESHLDLAIEDNLRRGMSATEARREALIRFGGAAQAREGHREARGLPVLDHLRQDLGFGVRLLRRSPGFSILAILCLTLGIGATTAVFSWIEGILLRPFPAVTNQDRLVAVSGTARNAPGSEDVSWPD